jgi:alkaline phosphatase D
MPTTRRDFLTYGAAIGAGAMTPAIASGTADAADSRDHALKLRRDPFTLGVAAGDPEPDGFVIWTRLAVDPHAADGLGGMPDLRIPVSWQIATDERFRRVVRRGVSTTNRDRGYAIHVEVDDLRPAREYWYRFAVGPFISRTGRAVTAPRRDAMPSALAMSFVSCSQFEHGLFTAYRRLAEDRPDLVLHLGDYQYEYTAHDYEAPGGNVRDHDGPETTTLESYRQRHAQYKTDLDMQEAHAATAWAVVFDDHEVDNNWAGDIPEHVEETSGFVQRRQAAFRAYYENMPLRRTSVPRGTHMQLYRRLHWGRLATFHMLDTRQFRDDQAAGDGYQTDVPAAVDPRRSITGKEQEEWLIDGFHRSRARWDVLGQQVFMAQRDNNKGPMKTVSMDSWDGYAASRDRITRGWVDAEVRNPVVLTGDVHAHWASELKLDYDDPTTRSVGTELVCSSITSGGNGSDSGVTDHPWLEWNPHLKFQNNLRGYVNTTITPDDLTADFRCVDQIRTPGAAAFTRARFVVEDRVPELNLTYDRGASPSVLRDRSDRDITRETVEWETQRP